MFGILTFNDNRESCLQTVLADKDTTVAYLEQVISTHPYNRQYDLPHTIVYCADTLNHILGFRVTKSIIKELEIHITDFDNLYKLSIDDINAKNSFTVEILLYHTTRKHLVKVEDEGQVRRIIYNIVKYLLFDDEYKIRLSLNKDGITTFHDFIKMVESVDIL